MTKTIEVSDETYAALEAAAGKEQMTVAGFLEEIANHCRAVDTQYSNEELKQIREAMDALDRGEGVGHASVMAELRQQRFSHDD